MLGILLIDGRSWTQYPSDQYKLEEDITECQSIMTVFPPQV